jgi:hypothetical protein
LGGDFWLLWSVCELAPLMGFTYNVSPSRLFPGPQLESAAADIRFCLSIFCRIAFLTYVSSVLASVLA